mgnify:CR=1 FL=1
MSTPGSSSFDSTPRQGQTRQDLVGRPQLSPDSVRAVEEIFGRSGGAISADGSDPQSAKLSSLLRLLDVPMAQAEANRELIVDLTIARVARAAQRRTSEQTAGSFVDGDLSPEDDDALEALVEAGMDLARVPSAIRARAAQQLQLLQSLDVSKGLDGDRDSLITRTLATIQEHIERDESRMELSGAGALAEDAGYTGFRPRFRLSDLVTAAALLLIAFGVLAPITSAIRGYSGRMECQANLSAAGLGFGLYAGSNKDVLPMATASVAGRPWWFVGRSPDQSNAANLYTLVRTGNASLGHLACAGNRNALTSDDRKDAMDWGRLEEVSYSYQNLFATERPTWSAPSRTIVLVDRSPVILKAYQGLPIDPLENSPNHGGRGQFALYNDGSAEWLRSPVLQNGDNIWLPRRVEHMIRQLTQPRSADPLQGTESPESADDVFVGP